MYEYWTNIVHILSKYCPNIAQILPKYCPNIVQISYYLRSVIKDIDNGIRKCVPYSQRLCSHWPTWPNPVLWLVNLGRPWKWPSRSRIFLGVGVSRPYRVRIISYFGDPSQKCLTKKFKGGGYFFHDILNCGLEQADDQKFCRHVNQRINLTQQAFNNENV